MYDPLKIYIASSYRNKHFVQILSGALEEGHWCKVLDWTKLAPPVSRSLPIEERRRVFDTDERGEIFEFCRNACGGLADLVIYLGPAGQDAAAEVALAYASGVPVLGLASPLEAPGLIVNGIVGRWCEDVTDLLDAVQEHAKAKCDLAH